MSVTWASSSATCSAVMGRPSSCSARASSTHSRRQVWNRMSGENRCSMYFDAYREARGDS